MPVKVVGWVTFAVVALIVWGCEAEVHTPVREKSVQVARPVINVITLKQRADSLFIVCNLVGVDECWGFLERIDRNPRLRDAINFAHSQGIKTFWPWRSETAKLNSYHLDNYHKDNVSIAFSIYSSDQELIQFMENPRSPENK